MDYDINFDDLANKLFCTFTAEEKLDSTIDTIKEQYQILFNKIFVLYIESTNEYVCTYNVDSFNMADTIYTINTLNDLIRVLNEGKLDKNFRVNWQEYRNCILLTTSGELKKLDTKVHEIINF